MVHDEKILNRVRALLAKAEDPGATEAEAEALTAKAAELMARYGIDEAMAAARAETRQVPADKTLDFENPYAKQKLHLYYQILLAFGGDAVRLPGNAVRARVFGFRTDLDAVEILYTSLLLQAANQSYRVPPGESARAYRVAFWLGFAAKIGQRLRESMEATKTEAEEKTPGTALVLRDRSVAVQDAMKDAFPKTRTSRSYYRSTAGYQAGAEAGARANLHNRAEARGTSSAALGR